jgi:hypothetical protein
MFVCQKITYNEIKKQNTMLYEVSEMSAASSNALTLFLASDTT